MKEGLYCVFLEDIQLGPGTHLVSFTRKVIERYSLSAKSIKSLLALIEQKWSYIQNYNFVIAILHYVPQYLYLRRISNLDELTSQVRDYFRLRSSIHSLDQLISITQQENHQTEEVDHALFEYDLLSDSNCSLNNENSDDEKLSSESTGQSVSLVNYIQSLCDLTNKYPPFINTHLNQDSNQKRGLVEVYQCPECDRIYVKDIYCSSLKCPSNKT